MRGEMTAATATRCQGLNEFEVEGDLGHSSTCRPTASLAEDGQAFLLGLLSPQHVRVRFVAPCNGRSAGSKGDGAHQVGAIEQQVSGLVQCCAGLWLVGRERGCACGHTLQHPTQCPPLLPRWLSQGRNISG